MLICMFGCGGDRDPLKRPIMGEIAEKQADKVIVTSDNPRKEDPQKIIDQIMLGMKNPRNATQIVDRSKAILHAVLYSNKNDVILLAGKGHETTQEIMGKIIHFSDQEHAIRAIKKLYRKNN